MASTSDSDRRGRHRRRNRHTWDVNSSFDAHKNVGSSAACIDLTVDISGDDIIDLTHGHSMTVTEIPAEVLSADDDVGPVRTRRRNGRRGRRINSRRSILDPVVGSSSSVNISPYVHVLSDDSDSDSLPELPFEFTPPSVADNGITQKSPTGVKISCPVCLDDAKQIQRSGRQMMSTTCGHIFCQECIRQAIRHQHTCPTCRKKITQRSVHPLFL